MSGGSIAQASTELINWGMRALGRWSKDGFFAHDVDLLQGGPHFFLGLGLYILKMATRKDPADNNGELPSTTREVLLEATKVFSQLGFSNVVRALRIRYADGKRQGLDYEALLGRLREGAMDIFDRSFEPESRITSAAQHLSAAAARLALSLVRSLPHLPEATWGALQPRSSPPQRSSSAARSWPWTPWPA